MLQHTFTPSDVTEKSGYLDQSIISQCSVLLKIPERETQNQFSCRGDVTFSRAFTAQVKVKHESSARSKTHTRAFQTNWFFHFSANFKNKIEQTSSQNLEIPGSCYIAHLPSRRMQRFSFTTRYCGSREACIHRTQPCTWPEGSQHCDPKRLISKYPVYTHLQTQRNTSTLTYQSQTATCKVHRLNPLYFLRYLGLLSCSPGKTNVWKKPDLLDKLNAKRG